MSTDRHPLGIIKNLGEKTIRGLDDQITGDLILPDNEQDCHGPPMQPR